MKLRRRFSSSLHPLFAHPLRTVLALSGVAVGVGAFVVSRAIGDGARAEMVRTVESLGTNLLIVKPVPVKRLVARRAVSGFATTLTDEDVAAVAALPGVAAAAPAIEDTVRVKRNATAAKTTVRGTTAAYLRLRAFELQAGRFLGPTDDDEVRRVAVLGARIARELFPAGPAVGGELRVRGVPFEVIGVLRAKGTTADGADQDNQVLVPFRTALRRVFNVRWLTSAYVGVTDPVRMEEATLAIERLLRQRHRVGERRAADDFAVQNTARTRAFQQELTAAFGRYAAGLAAVALLVGGFGVLALMFLSVRERTAEIGLRIAVGARRRDILLQFLIEAVFLALAGWAAGVVLGGLACAAVACGTSWAVALPLVPAATALGMALTIGMGFGALPARRAARIPPIEALVRT
jgi:putative ABC transport system permease protein